MTEWKSIDSAPRDGRFIDSYNAHNGERRTSRWDETHWGLNTKWIGWDGQWGNVPTHWQSLPEPPNVGTNVGSPKPL